MTEPTNTATGHERTSGTSVRPVLPHDLTPDRGEIGDRANLADEVKGALERIRKAAENWKNGMAGLVALVTATLLFKGEDKISSYETGVQLTLAGLALVALGLGMLSLWLFLRAAHGRIRQVTSDSIIRDGGIEVRNNKLATEALEDLGCAQKVALVSAFLLAAAICVSWFGPTAESKPPAFTHMVVRGATASEPSVSVCGELTAQDGATTVLKVKGRPDDLRVPTQRLVSVVLLKTCS